VAANSPAEGQGLKGLLALFPPAFRDLTAKHLAAHAHASDDTVRCVMASLRELRDATLCHGAGHSVPGGVEEQALLEWFVAIEEALRSYGRGELAAKPQGKTEEWSGSRAQDSVEAAGKVGLVNLGNTCYAAAFLQVLARATPFVRRLYRPPPARGEIAAEVSGTVLELRRLCYFLALSDRGAVSPARLLATLPPETFCKGRQHDAAEFGKFLLARVEAAYGSLLPRSLARSALGAGGGADASDGSEDGCPQTRCPVGVLSGTLESTVRCGGCGAKSRRHEVFWDLQVPVPSPKGEQGDCHAAAPPARGVPQLAAGQSFGGGVSPAELRSQGSAGAATDSEGSAGAATDSEGSAGAATDSEGSAGAATDSDVSRVPGPGEGTSGATAAPGGAPALHAEVMADESLSAGGEKPAGGGAALWGEPEEVGELLRKLVLHEEALEGAERYCCDACGGRCDAVRRLAVARPPQILQLTLLRFSGGPAGNTKNCARVPIDEALVLPLADGERVSYHLCGVCVHVGLAAESGHYYALVRDALGGGWLRCDDESVAAAPAHDDPAASRSPLHRCRCSAEQGFVTC